tara:strand:+ start:157 stop:660 length:504 start_codon:yes stop_codon:yes gene_type:complete
MKRLWVKYLSLILILAQTSVLFADTLTFNNGQKINGKLISISEEHELNPKTGVTSEVTFKVDDYQLKMISEELIVGKVDNSTLMFDKKSIYKITDDRGNVIFWNKINLINTKELRDKISITKLPLPYEPKCREGISPELCNAAHKIFLYGFCSFCVWALVWVFFVPV